MQAFNPCFWSSMLWFYWNTLKNRLKSSIQDWLKVKDAGADLMIWWDSMFKGGVKYLAIERGKELKKEKLGILTAKIETGVLHFPSPR